MRSSSTISCPRCKTKNRIPDKVRPGKQPVCWQCGSSIDGQTARNPTVLQKLMAMGLVGLVVAGLRLAGKNADELAPLLKPTIGSSDDIVRTVFQNSDGLSSQAVVKGVKDINAITPVLRSTDDVMPSVPLEDYGRKNTVVMPSRDAIKEAVGDVIRDVSEEYISNRLKDIRQRALVSQAQERLKGMGFDPGPFDGIFGPKTREALRQFQIAHDLSATDELDTATLKALGIY